MTQKKAGEGYYEGLFRKFLRQDVCHNVSSLYRKIHYDQPLSGNIPQLVIDNPAIYRYLLTDYLNFFYNKYQGNFFGKFPTLTLPSELLS